MSYSEMDKLSFGKKNYQKWLKWFSVKSILSHKKVASVMTLNKRYEPPELMEVDYSAGFPSSVHCPMQTNNHSL
jgi:hypothetical protein